jgi:hypothetical protein
MAHIVRCFGDSVKDEKQQITRSQKLGWPDQRCRATMEVVERLGSFLEQQIS